MKEAGKRMMHVNGYLKLFLVLVCVAAFVPGCSLINPHVSVRWDPPKGYSVEKAIDYANGAKKQYQKAIGDQAILSNSTALLLIPAGALALGLATHPGNQDTLLALGLGGAGAYAAGNWLSSKPRQLVYVNGIKAIDCAIRAVLPLKVAESEEKEFNLELQKLGESIAQVTFGIAEVRRLDATQDILRDAESMLKTARNAYSSGIALQLERGRAGASLVVAVDDISAEVDRAIVSTLPDLQALPGIIGSLAQTSSQFSRVEIPVDVLTPAKREVPRNGASRGTAGAVSREDPAVTKLKEGLVKLRCLSQHVASVVNAVRQASKNLDLKQCGVLEVSMALNAEPDVVQLDQAGGIARILVSGGKPPYMAEMSVGPAKGLIVTTAPPWVILTANQIPAGTYKLLISDAALNTKTVTVTVQAAN